MQNLSLLTDERIRNLRPGTKLYCVSDGHSYTGSIFKGKWYTVKGVRDASWANESRVVLNETGDFGWKPSRFEINSIINYKGELNSFGYNKKEMT